MTLSRIGQFIASQLFKALLLMLAMLAALALVLMDPAQLKRNLADNKVYAPIMQHLLQQSTAAAGSESPLLAQAPIVQAAAEKAFTPELLQTSTENVIDGVYHWMQGLRPEPNFHIDLTQAKQTFGREIANGARGRANNLPVCTLQQLRALDPSNIDPLTITCLPPGVNIESELQRLEREVSGSQDFLADPVLTAADLPRSSDGKTAFEQLAYVPKLYQQVPALLWITALLTLITGAGSIALHPDRRRGARSAALALIGAAAFLAIGITLYTYLLGRTDIAGGSPDSLQPVILSVVRTFTAAINRILLIFGIAYTLIGLVILVLLRSQQQTPAQG